MVYSCFLFLYNLITNRVYKEGKYTDREAVIIATGFSTVSATFMIIVAKTLGLMEMWSAYFFATVIVTFLVTAITARIYPIKNKKDEYFNNIKGDVEQEIKENKFKVALSEAITTCENAVPILKNIQDNFIDGIKLAINIAPLLLAVGTIGLILANYTPIFNIIAYIFYPFTYICGYEEPYLVSKALSLGIAEMFLPPLLVTQLSFDVKFMVAITCVSEVLFFSAFIPCMMATEIPIKFTDYLVIWFERVVLSVLLCVPVIYVVKLFM